MNVFWKAYFLLLIITTLCTWNNSNDQFDALLVLNTQPLNSAAENLPIILSAKIVIVTIINWVKYGFACRVNKLHNYGPIDRSCLSYRKWPILIEPVDLAPVVALKSFLNDTIDT